MTISLTGATGFIGRALLKQLTTSGYRVRALTRRPRSDPGIEWLVGDIESEGTLRQLAAESDVFIHLAGLTKAITRAELLKINGTAAGRAAAAATAAGTRRFILVSSLAAREPHLSNYAASKRAGEDAARAARGQDELVIIRPPAIIGPGDDATAQMLGAMQAGWLPVPGGKAAKSTRLSFIYVDDIARYIADQIDAPLPAGTVEPTAEPAGTSWVELAKTASNVLSKPVRLVRIPPLLLKPSAAAMETICAVFGKSSFFNAGKVREMLHTDWTGRVRISDARGLSESLRLAFELDTDV
ncbi:MAG: NAD-dependent epimerase/dehydratase family protein [Pseudomonadota bacterium]